MTYAIIRVRLPAVKNLKISVVVAESGDQCYWCEIQTVRYIRDQRKKKVVKKRQ